MDLTRIKTFLGTDWKRFEQLMSGSLKSGIDLLDKTNGMILSNSGKQLRPLISLLIARACSSCLPVSEESIRYAAASELLHNATLLHDDVADESDRRRGKPTVNSLMGPSSSVLIGDYWLVKAVDNVIGRDKCNMKILRLFSRTLSDLAEGEMLQLQKARSGDTCKEDYLRIIYCKTASLFEVTAVSAAVSAGANPQTEKAICDYGISLGMAFQIRDDIFDYQPSLNVGKPSGVDVLEQKITLPLLGAFANVSSREEREVREKVMNIISHPEARDEIMDFVHRNGGISYATAELNTYIDRAVSSLSVLRESEEKEYLAEIAHYVADRLN